MPARNDLSETIQRFFTDKDVEVDLNEEVHGKFYTSSGLDVYLYIPVSLEYIQIFIDFYSISDDDICALPVYCMAENVRDETWPRRVFGIDPERRMIVYLQLFPVHPGMPFDLKSATEDLAHAAQNHMSEIGALLSSSESQDAGRGLDTSENVIFKA